MLWLKAFLVVLHILIAVSWFGLALRLQTLVRMVHHLDAKGLGDRTVLGMTVTAVLLPFVGLGAMLADPRGIVGFGPEYHTSVTLALVLAGVQLFGIHRVWRGLPESGKARLMPMWIGIGHLLWLVILILMLWPQYLAPAFFSAFSTAA